MNNIRIKKETLEGKECITVDSLSPNKTQWYEISIVGDDPLYKEFLKLYEITEGLYDKK
jgi:hypothetical protein